MLVEVSRLMDFATAVFLRAAAVQASQDKWP
jgi:hypothetical protein